MEKYILDDVEVRFENCLETMRNMEPESVDLAITSPPYFVEQDYEKGVAWPEYLDLLWNSYVGIARVLKPGGYYVVNFGDQARGKHIKFTETHTTIPMSIEHWDCGRAQGLELQATRIWRKKFARMGIPFVCNHYPRPVYDYEHIWTWRKPDGTGKEIVRDRKLSQRGVLEFEGDNPQKRFKAAFPVSLPEWAIQVYSDPGDLIYDPFTGSGTTALAARRLGRRFMGSEIDIELRLVIQELLEN